MIIDILTIFPEMFSGPFSASIIKRAQEKGLLIINLINLRDFSRNKHRTVDDAPYGGGAGMVMAPQPFFEAIDWLKSQRHALGRVILLCPTGQVFSQALAGELAREEHLVLICGHYEGVDERVREHLITDEVSIGDYILTGGELPAALMVDAVSRLIPGVLGKNASLQEETFQQGLLEYPQYTRPPVYRNYTVPEVLLSGHHEKVRRWRKKQALLRTLERRPELLNPVLLTTEDREILKEILIFLKQLNLE
ncbi:MAG TPA: tRNA (guanosine(37)-N1)-methyltransferase TrmD [Desulfotomaculum sp.]|nr:tRNA (guanosine(37)-N1)-methyltransferase TrmD [Desulfotomaculum sp.]